MLVFALAYSCTCTFCFSLISGEERRFLFFSLLLGWFVSQNENLILTFRHVLRVRSTIDEFPLKSLTYLNSQQNSVQYSNMCNSLTTSIYDSQCKESVLWSTNFSVHYLYSSNSTLPPELRQVYLNRNVGSVARDFVPTSK